MAETVYLVTQDDNLVKSESVIGIAGSLEKAQAMALEHFDNEEAKVDEFGYTVTCPGQYDIEISEWDLMR